MLQQAELAAWLRLLETPSLGLEAARRLLAAAGSAEAAWSLPAPALQNLLSDKQREAFRIEPPELPALIESTWAWLQADASHDLLLLGDADYPDALLQTADPPLLLYLRGRRELLQQPMLAIVGSRKPTAQGRDNAAHFATDLAAAGQLIVSGLALGVDGAAHEGALAAGAGTVAVIGTGINRIYPRRHEALTRRIAAEGLIVSEYSLGTPPLQSNFPRRNRIIAGLAQGCLVVEAALESGSLITARLASEAGREVFAIPGSIRSEQSRGCHALIRQGAKLVENAADVLEELLPSAPNRAAAPESPEPALTPAQRLVLDRMGFEPVSFDELLARGAGAPDQLAALLLDLELAGLVARLAGQLFQRRVRA